MGGSGCTAHAPLHQALLHHEIQLHCHPTMSQHPSQAGILGGSGCTAHAPLHQALLRHEIQLRRHLTMCQHPSQAGSLGGSGRVAHAPLHQTLLHHAICLHPEDVAVRLLGPAEGAAKGDRPPRTGVHITCSARAVPFGAFSWGRSMFNCTAGTPYLWRLRCGRLPVPSVTAMVGCED